MRIGPSKTKPRMEISNGKGAHLTVEDLADQFHRGRCGHDLRAVKPHKDPNS